MNKRCVNLLIISLFISGIFFAGGLHAKKDENYQTNIKEGGKEPGGGKEKTDAGERNFCYECHMSLSGKLKKPCLDLKDSVHSVEGEQCNMCHGGNPNVFDARQAKSENYDFSPGPGGEGIPAFCGRVDCHSVAYSQFKKSTHYEAVLKNGIPSCTTCHGVHNIKRSSMETLSISSCIACHELSYATEIVNSVFEIEKEFDQIDKSIEFLEAKNIEVDEVNSKLQEIKGIFYQLVHAFSQDLMVFSKRIIDLEAKALRDELGKKVAMLRRIDLLYMMTFITLLSIIVIFILYYLWSNYKRKRKFRQKADA